MIFANHIMKRLQITKKTLISLPFFTIILVSMSGCSKSIDFNTVNPFLESGKDNLLFLFSGIYLTLLISILSILFSIFVGFNVSLMYFNKKTLLINRSYVQIFRAIPLLVLMLWVYYGVPQILSISINSFWAAVISISLSDSAFMAEIFRSGFQSINKNQYESAQSLALNKIQIMLLIIAPQAVRNILPAVGNQFVYIVKMSSIGSIIGVHELTRKANELSVVEYRPLEIYTILAIEYLLLIMLLSYGVSIFEKNLRKKY